MEKSIKTILVLVLTALWAAGGVHAQTTGKIAGQVKDAQTMEPLIGANVVVEGTTLGAATDADGTFYIINVPPGNYTLGIYMIGYENVKLQNLSVSVNRTSTVEIKMNPSTLEGEEVIVEAQGIELKKDQTSSVRNISSNQIDILPVEDVNAVVTMQAGVVDGHFRGGRLNEVAYMVDGLQVTEAFNNEGRAVDLEPEVVKDLEVITGTFNAEYGRAMSGVVNAVTKDGGPQFEGSLTVYGGNFITSHNDIFPGLKNREIDRNQDYKFQLSGPVWRDKITFLGNVRYQNNKNHLNGIRLFQVNDYSDFSSTEPFQWISQPSGDRAYVPMNSNKNLSFMGKIAFNLISAMKMSLLYTRNKDDWGGYDHAYKYNPDGMARTHRTSDMYMFQLNHSLSKSAFYELKLSYLNDYNGWYVYENPLDPRYVHDGYLRSDDVTGFYTGGQEKGHSRRTLKDYNIKYDLLWQVNKRHSLKTGILFTQHDLDNRYSEIRNRYWGTDQELAMGIDSLTGKINFLYYDPVVYPDSSEHSDIYRVQPQEFSAYVQDKMEFKEMVINGGVRFDYFNPQARYPSQRRNPSNQLSFPDNPEKMSTYPQADPQYQISPRLGLSYQLGREAVLHFSYGHFFQMPPLSAMYENHSFHVSNNDYETTMGNVQLKAQKTVQYEVGLWQQLMTGMGLEVSLFYRDIYDLLSVKTISTFNQIEYGLYTNKDYANAKGLEIKYDFVSGSVSAYVNYTLQYTRGNADEPNTSFTREGDQMDPINKLIPMAHSPHTIIRVRHTPGLPSRKTGWRM
ncbi:MAG: TonB-dependent receptor [Calditrichia bacterium]